MARARTIPELRRLVESLGGTLEDDRVGSYTHLIADAPAGKVWTDSGTHSLVGDVVKGPASWLRDTIGYLQDRIEHGLADCTDTDCEVC